MVKLLNYQVKLVALLYSFECGSLSYCSLNKLPIVSQHNGFLLTINKFFN